MSGIDMFVGSGTGFCAIKYSNACACGCTVILRHLVSSFDLLLMVLAGPKGFCNNWHQPETVSQFVLGMKSSVKV